MKKILIVIAVLIIVLPSFLATAAAKDSTEEVKNKQEGKVSSKDEVVYAKLSATGDRQEIYVVNTLDVTKAGKVVDFGNYSSRKNLTDLSELKQISNKVEFTAAEGKFFYQGNLAEEPLPWDLSIAYFLDGKEISPEQLAGKAGHLQIRIETSANKQVNPVFFENYLLQISLTLDSSIASNVKAEDGMIANAGKNKQVTFTVMPEHEEELIIEADVVDFELEGIDITGIPSTMSIELPDTDDMTNDINTLAGAIAEVNEGVTVLKNGVSELSNGARNLHAGSQQYRDGISELGGSSTDLLAGSKNIDKALETISQSLGNSDDIDLSELEQLANGLKQMSSGLNETSKGLTTLKENYTDAYQALNMVMDAIPQYELSEKDIQQLYSSDADQEVVKKLVETYTAAQAAKGTYSQVKQGFDVVDSSLDNAVTGIKEMANNMNALADGLSSLENSSDMDSLKQLQEGIATLSASYKEFHSGLTEYTGGVNQLANSYDELHNGIAQLSGGTDELNKGVGELQGGTSKLHESTKDLPKQMTDEIDEMIADYDKSDFDAVSFVSAKNKNVNSVQFVFKTASIKYEEPEVAEEPEKKENDGFWTRFMDLFS